MTKFNRKHYELLAEVLKDRINEIQKKHKTSETIGAMKEINKIADTLSNLFKEDNKKFDPEKFKKAVYGG